MSELLILLLAAVMSTPVRAYDPAPGYFYGQQPATYSYDRQQQENRQRELLREQQRQTAEQKKQTKLMEEELDLQKKDSVRIKTVRKL